MADKGRSRSSIIDERRLSIIVLALFSSWMLALPFEGQILYEIAGKFNVDPHRMVFGAVAAMAGGLIFWGPLIRTKKAAKRLMLCSMALCIIASVSFFYPPSHLWTIALILNAFFISASIVGWGYYFRSGTPKNERIKTAAQGLIYTNILMILLNMSAIHLSPHTGLGLSMLALGGAFIFALLLPEEDVAMLPSRPGQREVPAGIAKPLAMLCLFILVITINSGLMYQVLNPAFAHLRWLTSWYWAIPYIMAIYIMKNLSRKTNRSYFLYIALAMIGFSFVAFMILDHSVASYFVINTLMLGACGICDLFWWSILGEMLNLSANPAQIFGMGLAANVVGVLIGGVIGNILTLSKDSYQYPTALALTVVCINLIILPLLNRHLSAFLEHHVVSQSIWEGTLPSAPDKLTSRLAQFGILSAREIQVAALLLQGKTYRKIAAELYISENTVKTHIKNIYSKYNIQSRSELIDLMQEECSGR